MGIYMTIAIILTGFIILEIIVQSLSKEVKIVNPDFLDQDFSPTRFYNKNTYVAVDEEKQKMALFLSEETKVFSCEKIVDVQLAVEKHSESTKGCGAAIALGFVFGTLCFLSGGWGLLVVGVALGLILGGTFTPFKHVEKTHKIFLKLTLDDATYPVINIPFLEMSDAEQWLHEIEAIIQKQPPISTENKNENNNLVADELRKLHQLMLDGIISDAEFQNLKAKLIFGNA